VTGIQAHGWITSPVSKNEMAYNHWTPGMPDSLRYEPQTCYWGNTAGHMQDGAGYSCGAKEASASQGLATWQAMYDKAKVPVPPIAPGQEISVNITITADHGGQSWLMIACDDHIGEDVNWTYLERAASDRGHHYMPSNPGIYAWATSEAASRTNSKISATWEVPQNFSCPGGRVVGRWLWKTGSSCNDAKNVGRKTEPFVLSEFQKVVNDFRPGGWVKAVCDVPPETFISCLDFLVTGAPPGPPTPPAPPPPPPPPPPPKTPTCCWSNWGDDSTCGDYTGPGSQCNTDISKHCNTNSDCAKPVALVQEMLVEPLVKPTCCYSKWGDESTCGGYTGPGSQCNTDHSKHCTSSSDCPDTPTPTPPGPPTPPTPPTPPAPPTPPVPPTPTPGPEAVNACHDAAKHFCTTKGGYCKACQAWGNWGDMFFTTICNDDPSTCHQPLQAAGNVTCFCQQKGGCTVGGTTCPGPS